MKRFILLFSLSLMAMKEDITITIDKNDLKESQQKEVKCSCLLCKGVKITIATNILSMLTVAGIGALVNYSQCSK